jgi:DNA repair protein RecN (Recombination protein N)
LSVLDAVAADTKLTQSYAQAYALWSDTRKSLAKAIASLEEGKKDEDYMRFLHAELTNFRPQPGEDDDLQQQCDTMEHAQDIRMALTQGCCLLSDGETPVTESLRQVRNLLNSVQKHFPIAQELAERLESCRIELQDIAGTLESEAESIDCDPERMEQVQSRLNTLFSLEQKHHVGSSDELLAIMQELQDKLDIMDNSDEHIQQLQKQEAEARTEVNKLATSLTTLRNATARKVEKDIISSLKTLGMPNVRFKVDITPTEAPTPRGMDKVAFLFSANLGSPMQNISQVASGGETARVMLSLKAMLSGAISLPTIIFDEIDTGVSGHIAEAMAHIMQEMGRQGRQVISITHLPQIAAMGGHHFKVWKEDTQTHTLSHITCLSQEERVSEIANMLSGSNVSPEAINNARALLGL